MQIAKSSLMVMPVFAREICSSVLFARICGIAEMDEASFASQKSSISVFNQDESAISSIE